MEVDLSAITYLATTLYNITPIEESIVSLCGYDDKNFRLTDAIDGQTYVLKIVNPANSVQELTDIIDEVISSAHEYCSADQSLKFSTPKLIRTSAQRLSSQVSIRLRLTPNADQLDRLCNVKLFEFVPSVTLMGLVNSEQQQAVLPDIQQLYSSLGQMCSQLFRFLRTKQHLREKLSQIRSSQSFAWQLITCSVGVAQHTERLYADKSCEQRVLIGKVLQEFSEIRAQLHQLPQFVIHGDLSPNNILFPLKDDKQPNLDRFYLIDFQDLQLGPQVAEFAILALYSVLGQRQLELPMAVERIPTWLLGGYQKSAESFRLSKEEIGTIPTLMKLRLCQSLLNGQLAHELDPSNDYVMQTNKRGWQLLKLLDDRFADAGSLAAVWATQ